ncbi:MAG: GntR family transcriptional regulator [Armatimonadota bacterium]
MGIVEFDLNVEFVKPQSLGDKVADIIRDRIIMGEYAPGMRLTEDGFAKALGISRPCVKEAFYILESEGLVTRRVRNKHTEVVAFGKQDIKEIVSLRASIEILCAQLLIEEGTVPETGLRSHLDMLVPLRDAGMPSKDHVLADLAFHEVIVTSSGNKRAIAVWKSLESQMKTIMFSVHKSYPDEVTKTVKTHGDIMNALISRDSDTVTRLIKEHVMGNLSFLIKLFERQVTQDAGS